MSESTFSNKTFLVSGFVMMIVVLASFAWVWFKTPRPDESIYRTSANLQIPDISGIEKRASSLLEGMTNSGGIPIPTPTEKMGREDPFASL
jgi:hypothetical protein